jgi:uncharacterized protein YggE
MRKTFLLLILFSIPYCLEYQRNSINIRGKATLEVEPNHSQFKVGVVKYHKVLDSAIIQLNESILNIEKVFKEYGLDKNKARIKNLDIKQEYEWVDRANRVKEFKEFKVTRKYDVNFDDIDKLGKFLFQLYKHGANNLDDINFTRTDQEKLDRKLIIMAIKNAASKGEIVATQLNLRLGAPDVISDDPPTGFSYQNRVHFDFPIFGNEKVPDMLSGLLGGVGGSTKTPMEAFFDINPGKIKLSKTVWITYRTTQIN